jgi:hypothetical protein
MVNKMKILCYVGKHRFETYINQRLANELNKPGLMLSGNPYYSKCSDCGIHPRYTKWQYAKDVMYNIRNIFNTTER